jgi:hypothetical protein
MVGKRSFLLMIDIVTSILKDETISTRPYISHNEDTRPGKTEFISGGMKSWQTSSRGA